MEDEISWIGGLGKEGEISWMMVWGRKVRKMNDEVVVWGKDFNQIFCTFRTI